MSTWIGRISLGVLLLCCIGQLSAARLTYKFDGNDLSQRFVFPDSVFIEDSDSLYLNSRLLVRNTDYRFNIRPPYLEISPISISADDTLKFIIHTAPSWLRQPTGLSLPKVESESRQAVLPDPVYNPARRLGGSDLTVKGTKTFRVSSSGSGSSGFSQTLDLSMLGTIGKNVRLRGSVSDRNYNPVYGYSNSRLDELDKILIELESERFNARLGDIVLPRDSLRSASFKKMSGVSADYKGKSFSVGGTAARPKGSYEQATFMGSDGRQGPYQIGAAGRVTAIVPNSETVWLDGRPLQRGSDADYYIDYPLGELIFTSRQPITSRSRITIDYEPFRDEFKKEYLSLSSGVALIDSVLQFSIEFRREGDDNGEFVNELFSTPDRTVLASVGDKVDDASRSGVFADTTGSYALVTDSLPDSVFTYVGSGNGDYRLVFEQVGESLGQYRYIGNNRYQYVGNGNGDYLPKLTIPAPQRLDYIATGLNLQRTAIGKFDLTWRRSNFDRNTVSNLDDDDNAGNAYSLGYAYSGKEFLESISVSYLQLDSRFQTRERLLPVELTYRYMLPESLGVSNAKSVLESHVSFALTDNIRLTPGFTRHTQHKVFHANEPSIKTDIRLFKNFRLQSEGAWLSTDLKQVSDRKGEGYRYLSTATIKLFSNVSWSVSGNTDSREHTYDSVGRGTRYDQIRSILTYKKHALTAELYSEDTLDVTWNKDFTRKAIGYSGAGQSGEINYSAQVHFQELEKEGVTTDNFLSRVTLGYVSTKRRMTIQSGYLLSEETRNSRGITYLEVDHGQGDYIFEDSQYVVDPNGSFIRVEEILSDQARVERAEKNFSFSKQWPVISVRTESSIHEEMLPEGQRTLFWLLPFYSDHTQPFFYYNRRYHGQIRLFPDRNVNNVSLEFTDERESRTVNQSVKQKHDYSLSGRIRQKFKSILLEEYVAYAAKERDVYYNGGADITVREIGLTVITPQTRGESRIGLYYRYAKGSTDEISRQYQLRLGQRSRFLEKGEIQGSVELYYQELVGSGLLLTLTDNKPGKRGANWQARASYRLAKGSRFNLSISGRHADNRSARITGRLELVAGF